MYRNRTFQHVDIENVECQHCTEQECKLLAKSEKQLLKHRDASSIFSRKSRNRTFWFSRKTEEWPTQEDYSLNQNSFHWIPTSLLTSPHKGREGQAPPCLCGEVGIHWKLFWFSEWSSWKVILGRSFLCLPIFLFFYAKSKTEIAIAPSSSWTQWGEKTRLEFGHAARPMRFNTGGHQDKKSSKTKAAHFLKGF